MWTIALNHFLTWLYCLLPGFTSYYLRTRKRPTVKPMFNCTLLETWTNHIQSKWENENWSKCKRIHKQTNSAFVMPLHAFKWEFKVPKISSIYKFYNKDVANIILNAFRNVSRLDRLMNPILLHVFQKWMFSPPPIGCTVRHIAVTTTHHHGTYHHCNGNIFHDTR